MNAWTRMLLIVSLTLWVLSGVGGCTSAPQEVTVETNAIFYPPPPSEPRLQFLTSFSDAERWMIKKSSFADFVVGDKQQTEAPHKMHGPYGLAVYNQKLYVCDIPLHCVHIYDLANKTYSRLGQEDSFFGPVNITIDKDGTKYICDTHPQKSQILVFDANDRFVRAMGDPVRCVPIDVAIDGDQLYVCNIKQCKIEVWSKSSGELLRSFSSKGREPDQLRYPTNLAIGPDGNIYVVDSELSTVKVFNPEGNLLKLIGEPGDRPGYFARPKGIAIDPDGVIYIADAQWEIVQLFNPEGQTLLFFGGATDGPDRMGLPAGITIDRSSIDLYREYMAPGFEPEYLIFLANQFGDNKIGVYAFGKMKNP